MLNNLEPVIHTALMRILSTIYETGMVDTVALGDVLKLFGVEQIEDGESVFSFSDPGWVAAYISFKEDEGGTIVMLDDEDMAEIEAELEEFTAPSDLETNKKLH